MQCIGARRMQKFCVFASVLLTTQHGNKGIRAFNVIQQCVHQFIHHPVYDSSVGESVSASSGSNHKCWISARVL